MYSSVIFDETNTLLFEISRFQQKTFSLNSLTFCVDWAALLQKAFLNALEVIHDVERRRTLELGMPPRNVLRELARTPKLQVPNPMPRNVS